jgi:hypothetical protein
MTISGVSANSAYTSVNPLTAAQRPATTTTKSHHHQGGGGQLLDSIDQALSQMGISLNQQTQTPTSSSKAADNSGVSKDQMQALQQLMGDVFQAAQQQGAASASANGQPASFVSNLQNFLTSLNNPATSATGSTSGNATLNQLQSDFSNLLSANGTTGASGQNQNVMTFLQNLASNLGSTGSVPAAGSLISTTS